MILIWRVFTISQRKAIEFFVKKHYDQYLSSALAYELDQLYCEDQYYRGGLARAYRKAKGYTPDSLDIGILKMRELLDEIQKDQSHLMAKLDELLQGGQWPDPAEVGLRPSQALIYVLYHMIDTKIRKKYLPMVERAFEDGILSGRQYGHLVDSILMDEEKVQRYGTMFAPVDSTDPYLYKLAPLQYPQKVDSLRNTIGMPPVGLRQFTIRRKKEN